MWHYEQLNPIFGQGGRDTLDSGWSWEYKYLVNAAVKPALAPRGQVRWLSGGIVTPLNMYVLPALWYAAVFAPPVYSTIQTHHVPDLTRFGFVGIVVLVATISLTYLVTHMKRVGVENGQLVIANYRRTVRVPFKQVQNVHMVWCYWRRLIRIQLNPPCEFGRTIYYMPKWPTARLFSADPAESLRKSVMDTQRWQ